MEEEIRRGYFNYMKDLIASFHSETNTDVKKVLVQLLNNACSDYNHAYGREAPWVRQF